MRKKKSRIIATMMTFAMTVTGVLPLLLAESKTAKASDYGINNPVTDSEGVTTWDCVYFGNYYQSSANVKEPIKWRVLSVEGDDAFLLADQVLDRQQYHTSRTDNVTWSTSLVRSWLNGYSSNSNLSGIDYANDNFIDAAFSQSEQKAIYTTRVVNDDNPSYEIDGGPDTWDKIYLLSISDASNSSYGFESEFEQSSNTRKAFTTAYIENCSIDEFNEKSVEWWLRSPGIASYGASFVYGSGLGSVRGAYTDSRAPIRPALHLDLSSSGWKKAGSVGSDGSVELPTESPTSSPFSTELSPSPTADSTTVPSATSSPVGRQVADPVIDSEGVTSWDCIYFGNYWQDDTNGDGKEDRNGRKKPIKWRVLSVNGDDAFLLADQNLDAKEYHSNYSDVTWEGCTLRSWLNGYGSDRNLGNIDYSSDNFLDTAFTNIEQSAIFNTLVINDDNPEYGTEGGNDTLDKVYLLSIAEASKTEYGFFSDFDQSNDTRIAINTDYVEEQGAYTDSDTGSGWWWLRSPGDNTGRASEVNCDGCGYGHGVNANYDYDAVRPALHLNLSSTVWYNAGKVSSDGTAIEEPYPSASQDPVASPSITPTAGTTDRPTVTVAPAAKPSEDPASGITSAPAVSPTKSPDWGISRPSAAPVPTTRPSPIARPSQTKKPSVSAGTYDDDDDDEEEYSYSYYVSTKSKKSKLKEGQTVTLRKMKYKVTKVNGNGSGEVSLIGTSFKKSNRTFTSLKIGSSVMIQGCSCKITAVGSRAFHGYKKLKSITIGKNIQSIGKSAFSGCSGVRKLIIQTTKLTLKKVGCHAFALKAHVRPSMPRKKKKAYLTILQKRCK